MSEQDIHNNLNYLKYLETLPEGFSYHRFIYDEKDRPVDFACIYANPAFMRLFDLDLDTLYSKKGSDAISFFKIGNYDWLSICRQVVTSGISSTIELYFPTLSKWLLTTIYSNEPDCFALMFYDITNQKSLEKALLQSNKHLTEAQRIAHIGNWFWDIEHKTIDYSDELCRIVGFDYYKRKPRINEYYSLIHPDDYQKYLDAENAALKGASLCVEYRIIRPDGATIWVLDTAEVERDSKGIPLRMYGTIQDITRQKTMENQMAEMYNRLMEAQKVTRLGNWSYDLVNETVFWSDEIFMIMGFEPREIQPVVNTFRKYVHPDDAMRLMVAQDGAMNGEPYEIEFRIIRRDGKMLWLKSIGKVVTDNNGKPIRMYGTTQDITENKLVHLELQKVTEEYETIFNGTQDALFLVDISKENGMRYKRLNKSYERASGYSSDMVVGKTPSQVYGEKTGHEMESKYAECIRKRTSITYEETIENRDGSKSTYLSFLFPIIENNEVVQLVGSSRDITQEKAALEALKESEQLYSSLFENNLSVMLIFEPDTGNIVDANPAACAYYGYERSRLKTMNVLQINTLPREIYNLRIQQTLKKTKTSFNFQHRLSDGSIRDVESFSGAIYIQKKLLVYSIIHDVTERITAEKALQEEKERLNVTLHSIADAVIATDIHGKITLLNSVAKHLTGWDKSNIQGKPLHKIFNVLDPVTGISCIAPIEKVVTTAEPVELQAVILVSRDGTERYIDISSAPIKSIDGNVFGMVLVFRDITEKRMKEEEIKYLSFHDKLTGLYNRAFFEEELDRLNAERMLPLSIIIGDVNGLKLSNDVFGHHAGDKLLIKIAEILKESCRATDVIARWGGDEFAIILPNTTNTEATAICERIKNHCNTAKPDPIQPNIGLGASTKINPDQNIQFIIKDAEDKMYRHKFLEGKSVRGSIISSLKKTLFERNYETEAHTNRLLHIATRIGQKIGLSDSEQDELNLLAMLHDIGKIGIADHILMKPDKLTNEEWVEMKKHCEIGYRIAQASQELAHIADLILYHHERWDGKGYPHGLKELEIPKMSRIIAIIDTYDVMTHVRPYKTAVSHEEAIAEITRCAGSQFDPVLAETCIKVIGECVLEWD